MKVYGIPNCDTVKKVRKLLEEKGLDYDFIDFKKTPPTKALITKAEKFLGELPVNKRGTTFRKIKEEYESSNKSAQIELLLDQSSAIKRPLIEQSGKVVAVGKTGEFFDNL